MLNGIIKKLKGLGKQFGQAGAQYLGILGNPKAQGLALGLDIDQRRITVVGLQQSAKGLSLKYMGSCPTPSGTIERGEVVNVKGLAAAIKDLFINKQIKSGRVVIAIGVPAALIHLSKIPAMSDAEMQEALKTEVDHYIVFAGSQIVSDTYNLEEITEEGIRKSRVLLGAAKKETVESYLDAVKQAGLELEAVDINCLAVTRALYPSLLKSSAGGAGILVNVEFENTGFSVLRAGVLSYFHNAEFGNKDMANPAEFMAKLTAELKSIIGYYQSEHGQAINSVVLTGDAEQMQSLEKDLSVNFQGITVISGNTLEGIAYDKQGLSAEEIKILRNSPCAIGLAMRGIAAGGYTVNINLLPLEEERVRELQSQIRLFLFSLFASAIILFLYFIGIKMQIRSITSRARGLQQELAKPIPVLEELLGIEKGTGHYMDEIEKQNKIFATAQRKRWDRLLEEIKLIIPKEVRLTKLTDRRGSVLIMGESISQEGVFNFVRTLRGSPYFKEVRLHSSKDKKKQGKVYIDFNISCRLDIGED